MNLVDIATRARAIADSKKFDAPDWDKNFIHKVAFACTELDEAVQFVETETGHPIGEEMADTAIRIVDSLQGIWPGKWSAERIENRTIYAKVLNGALFRPVEVSLWRVLRQLCKAMECWRHGNQLDAMMCLEFVLLETFRFCDGIGIDLESEIEKKMAYNATRELRNGKATSTG